MRTFSWLQHVTANTGIPVHADTWLDAKSATDQMEIQTRAIASKLRAGGVEPERQINGRLCIVGAFSGGVQHVTAWRHINFLPTVARDNRRQLVRRLQYFAEDRPYLRYLVFTNGARCHVDDLRDRLRSLARSISNYAAESQLKAWGITVELRVSEITAERDDAGRWTYHPHANVIINCARPLGGEWNDFLAFTTAVAPGIWRDNARLFDAKEAVKYFTKPAEIAMHSPEEMVALLKATMGLKIAQPMGAFADLRRKLASDRVKLGKTMANGVWRWCFVSIGEREPKPGDAGGSNVNQVIAAMAAQPRFLPVMEPCLLVRNYNGSLESLLLGSEMMDPLSAARQRWNAQSAVGASLMSTPSPQLLVVKVPEKPPPKADNLVLCESP